MNQVVDRRAIEAAEDAVLDIQFDWIDIMNEAGITREQLSERLGISKARVSQMLSAGSNPTVKTVAKVYDALGRKMITKSTVLNAVAEATSDIVSASMQAAASNIRMEWFACASIVAEQKWVDVSVATNDNGAEIAFTEARMAKAG